MKIPKSRFRLSFLFLLFLLTVVLSTVAALYLTARNEPAVTLSPFPHGKNFAFTITDDPDGHRLEKIKPVYDFLIGIGMRTTVAVWVKEATRSDGIPDIPGNFDYGDTCQNQEYLEYIYELQKKGFEIALHTVSGGNDRREITRAGYNTFRTLFGEDPKINIMHSNNLDNVYWGKKVFQNSFIRFASSLITQKASFPFGGEDPKSPYFWGDILKDKTKYVRLWGTSDINTLKFNPSMPYHDLDKPFVNYWFSFSNGWNLQIFKDLISNKNVKTLIRERGASIVYTHFASGFTEKDETGVYRLDEGFKTQMEKLFQGKEGWFVPASVLLDRLLVMKNVGLFIFQNGIIVVNSNRTNVEGMTLLTNPDTVLYDANGIVFKPNAEGEVVLPELKANQAITLFMDKKNHFTRNPRPTRWEYLRLILKRTLVFIKNNNLY